MLTLQSPIIDYVACGLKAGADIIAGVSKCSAFVAAFCFPFAVIFCCLKFGAWLNHLIF